MDGERTNILKLPALYQLRDGTNIGGYDRSRGRAVANTSILTLVSACESSAPM